MINSNQLSPGMTVSVDNRIFRVESAVKVTVAKGNPFVKTKLKDLMNDEVVEKNFKLGQSVQDVALIERRLEYLYLEGQDYLFLDVGSLEQALVPAPIVGDKVNFLKEGTEVKAMFYGESVFSVDLPQFLELMVVKTETPEGSAPAANSTKTAILETGARINVPLFVEAGDIIKVDTQTNEYIQRV
jgi:elongation factor P